MAIREWLSSLPGTREVWWSWQSLLGKRLPFDGRWERVRKWLAEIERRARPGFRRRPKRRVFMYASLPFWMEACTVTAMALIEQGCEVEIAWHPREYLFNATDRNSRFQRWSAAKGGVPEHSCLRFKNVDELPDGEYPTHLEADLEKAAFLDTQYGSRKERVQVNDGPECELYHQRLTTLRDVARRLYPYLLERRSAYDWLIIPNGSILEFASLRVLASHLKLNYSTFEIHERRECIVLAHNRSCLPFNFDDLWAKDYPHVLTEDRRQRAERRLYARENPGMGQEYTWPGQIAAKTSSQEVFKSLGLDPARPTVLVATNIAWDSAVLGQSRAFSSMAEWTKHTVAWFARRPELQLIVRTHPAEAWNPSNETTADVIREVLENLPPNVRLIQPHEKVNTYSLLHGVRFGLLFTSTLGLEMACRGLTAITAGKVHYDGKGFTLDAMNADHYWQLVEGQLRREDDGRLESRQRELALCYFDLYFEKASSFPVLSAISAEQPASMDAALTACEAPAAVATLRQLIGLDAVTGPEGNP